MGISQLFCVLLGLRIEWTIPKCSVEKASDLLFASLICSCFFSLILLAGMYIFLPIQYDLYYYIPLFSFFLFSFEAFFIYNNKKGRYKFNASLQVIQGICFPIIALILKCQHGLIIGYIISLIVPSFISFGYWLFSLRTIPSLRAIGSIIENRGIQQWNICIGCFFNQLRQQLPILLLPFCFNCHYIGLFGLLTRIVSYPISIIANKVSDIIFQDIGERLRLKYPVCSFQKTLFWCIFFVGLISFVSIALFSDLICHYLIDKQWNVDRNLLRILSVGGFFYFVSSSFKQIPILYQKNRWFCNWHFYFAISLFLVFIVQKIASLSFITFLVLLTCVQIFFYLLNILKILQILRKAEL
jgi:O-antigen/teichoic acid export membrane protein